LAFLFYVVHKVTETLAAAAAAPSPLHRRRCCMPPKCIKAAAAAGTWASRLQKAGPAEPSPAKEETTEVNVYIFDARWQQKLHELYTDRKLTDVVLAVGDRSVAAHRVILATVSPHLQALFSNDTAESQSRVVELQQLSWAGVKAIVDFAYTGTVALSGSTVVSIIQAANLLQVEAVEQAAVDFLAERLDAGNVLSAMALGAHYSAGAICRGLRDKSRGWLQRNFALVAAEPSFLALQVAEVVALVKSDDLEAKEEEVFAAVLGWVKEDEVGRQAELGQLLPLVRFPMMAKPGPAIMDEPLVAQHPLALQLMYETHHDFVESKQAAACPRLLPRKGQRLGRGPALAFTRAADCYDISGAGGALLQGVAGCKCTYNPAVCADQRMAAGRHAAQFTFRTRPVEMGLAITVCQLRTMVGLARPQIELVTNAHQSGNFWGVGSTAGSVWHLEGRGAAWAGQQPFGAGDVVGLLLDCDAGTLTVKKNGVRLGVALTGLTGEFCWAASVYGDAIASVRIAAADAALF
jgi:hypothetical protein